MRLVGIVLALTSIATAQNSASVEGRVTDKATGLGIADAPVTLRFADQDYRAVTDSSGEFRLFGVPDGQYGMRIEKEGYIPLDTATEHSPLKIVSVDASGPAAQIRAELVRYARLSGRVLDREGRPVAGVNVMYSDAPGRTGQITNAAGDFTFAKVVPGSYLMQAVPPSAVKAPITPGVDRIEAVKTWYPAAAESDLAERIAVQSGADLRGIDVHLQSAPVYRVRGVVTGPDGQPVHAIVRNESEANRATTFGILQQAAPLGYFLLHRAHEISAVQTKADGRFEFPSVPRGSRRFVAQLAPSTRSGRLVLQTAVLSAGLDHDIDDLEMHLAPPVAVEGSIEFVGMSADSVRAVRTPIFVFGEMAASPGGIVGASFRIENVSPGDSRIAAPPGLAGGYYLDSVTLGGRDITWKSVGLQPGAGPVHIVYKPNAGAVTGAVESGEADYVVLIPQAALDSADVQYGRISRRTPQGRFEIDSVAPGSYYVFATGRLDAETLSSAGAARRLSDAAARVQIAAGTTISVNPPAIPPLW